MPRGLLLVLLVACDAAVPPDRTVKEPGIGRRQTDGEDFTYLDPVTGRAIAAANLTAFFRATLDDDPGARAYLGRKFPDLIVSVEHRE